MRGKGTQLDKRASNATCFGKEQFTSFRLADDIARRRSRNGKKNHVYRCGTCHVFHLGSTTGPSKRRPHQVLIEDDEVFA